MTKGPQIKFAKAFALTVGGTAAVYFAVFGWMVFVSPLTYAEMDINHDGKVEFFEAEYSASFGTLNVQKNGKQCIEFFALKDGLPLKVDCNGK